MANSQIQALLGQMQKTLECSICLEMMTNPVSTSCGHQFCRFCLMEFLDRKKQVPCPLCKKNITKRSLTDRVQLGEMVQGVRNIIAAFQKDTGVLFSPPRGPQTSIIPGTPESIQRKTTSKGANLDKRKSNTRQSKKSQSGINEDTDNVVERRTSGIESVEITAMDDENGVPHPNERKRKSHAKTRKSSTPNEAVFGVDRVDNKRQTELLKCIAEGQHGTNVLGNDDDVEIKVIENDCSEIMVEENSASTSGIESKFSSTPVTSSNEKREGLGSSNNKTLFAKESVNVNPDYEDADVDHDNGSASEVELIDGENENVKPDRTVNAVCSPDDEVTELSGSIEVDSQASSGPLFKTPIDLKSCVGKKSEFIEPVVNTKRSLRSRKGVVNYEGNNEELFNDSDVNSTPEIMVVKEKRIGKTYSKKDKESHKNEKKSTKKVAEWLKNIGEPFLIDNSVEENTNRDVPQKIKKSKKLSAKLQKEEEKMGNKMKHLAEQIQNKEKNLLLGYNDFECVEDNNERLKGLTDDHAAVVIKDVDESGNHAENVIDTPVESTELGDLWMSFTKAGTDSKDDAFGTDSNMYDRKVAEGLGNDSTACDLKRYELPKILNKKRIFKSRASKSGNCTDKPDKVFKQNESEVKQQIGGILADVNDLDKKEESIRGSIGNNPSTDPYEFKSSQPTPNKVVTKKSKGMKSKKNASKTQNKNKSSAKKTAIVDVKEDGMSGGQIDKMWNKNLRPDKTILKNRNDVNEINAFSVELQQAEGYDLLTSTQEAADCIDKEIKKHKKLHKPDDQFEKSTVSRKRVRFSEPTIADFTSSSHIDIIGYRKAKEEFRNKAKGTADLSGDHAITEKPDKTPCISADHTSESENTSHDVATNSEVELIDDESSGTDDLDIEPAFDEIEQPNLDIQPDEVKARLSQDLGELISFVKKNFDASTLPKCKSKDKSKRCPNARNEILTLDNENVTCVAETPQIPLDKDSPVITAVEETPMIPTIPKFNKKLSKPLKIQKRINSKPPKSKREHVIDKKSCNMNGKISKDSDPENEKVNDSVDNIVVPGSKGDKSREYSAELPFLDSVKKSVSDVSASLESTQPPDSETVINDGSKLSGDEKDTECEFSVDFEKTCSDSLSQRSELILHANVLPTKTQDMDKSPDKGNNSASDIYDKICIDAGKVDDNSDNEKELISKNGMSKTSLCTSSSGHTRITKKKRKSFMLERNEESLDFGSLNEEIVSPKSVRKRKRKRSGNSKMVENEDYRNIIVKVNGNLAMRSSGKYQGPEIENEDLATDDTKQSESVDIISDSISYSSTELSKSTSHDYIPADGQSSSVNLNVCASLDSPSNTLKKKRSRKTENEADEEVTIIGETECNSVEDSYPDMGLTGCQSENNSRSLKSPPQQKSRHKKNFGENNLKSDTDASEEGQHSSGLLISPEESVQSSGIDGHTKKTLMPSVDSSPLACIIRQESPCSEMKSSFDNENNVTKVTIALKKEKSPLKKSDVQLDKISECGSGSKRLPDDPDSSPGNKKRRSGIKAVRGFAKKKLHSQKLSPVCLGISPSPMSKHVFSSNIDNASKYSTSSKKMHSKQLEIDVNSEKIQPEIIEMDGDPDQMKEDVIVMSPYDLPDLDDKAHNQNMTDTTSDKSLGNFVQRKDVDDNSVVEREITSSLGKKSLSYLEDKSTIPETLSPTGDVINKLSQQSNRSELDDKQDNEIEVDSPKHHNESDHDSVDSSSEFNLDSSEDECPEKEALNVISNYNKIVRKSLNLENEIMNDDLEGATMKMSVNKGKKRLQNGEHLDKDVVDFNAADLYSCKLDSSPIEDEDAVVVLESDVEDSDYENKTRNVRAKANKVVETDDSDNEMDNVVRKKGAKRAIISDSSSEDDDETSQRMNMTSSSAFSSQSENMTTQEREALEKDLERMAAEMKAMKEQLRKSKAQSAGKETKVKMDTSHVDDDDHSIQDLISDASEEDFFLSQPPFDNHDEDVKVVDNNNESKVDCTLPDDSLQTIPESQPTSSTHQSVNADDVGDDTCDGGKKYEEKKRDIGIVVTGLNMSQVRDTKKLAAFNGCKFFNKFNDSVTHVVVKPADDDDTMCDRTLKFFQGIAKKCWIVNYFWVVDSREVGRLLPEGPYEIQGDTANNNAHFGPKKSRLSKEHQLFSSLHVALVGDNAFLSKDSMADLIKTCGGCVLELDKLGQGHKKSLVISCADLEDDHEQTRAVKQAKNIYKNHGFIMLTREWVLDSLTLYNVQPLQEYVITDIPNDKLPRL